MLLFSQLGQYSDLNREPTVPHTVALPIELYYPYNKNNSYSFLMKILFNYTFTIYCKKKSNKIEFSNLNLIIKLIIYL